MDALYQKIEAAFDAASERVTTGQLNRFLETLKAEREPRILYITQASIRPPTFVLFTDKPIALHFSKERYLTNQIRKRFGFGATPIVIKTKAKARRR